jgi:CBS domain-containing protein
MLVGHVCTRQANFCDAGATAEEALAQMSRGCVEELVVLADDVKDGGRTAVGIITRRDLSAFTDRALSTEEIAGKIDPASLTLGEIIGARCVSVSEDVSASRAMELMKVYGLRRLQVVDACNFPVGIVCADDLILAGRKGAERLTRISFYLRPHQADRTAA